MSIEDEYQCRLIVECRECGKLLKAGGQWEAVGAGQSEIYVMSSGIPIFGKCQSKRQNPGCVDKMAATVFLSEQVLRNTSTGRKSNAVWVSPDPYEQVAEAKGNKRRGRAKPA